ncbi:hypothetical protein ET495_05350 [Xylanimonas allomyrinae]|uniref:Uncharacterized protein n=1 Tax=Xylanimonas allomyrinae TaxID=2509459 RepID=A0A4P6EXK6_9MICO|nr:hypothetical protein [Xylanimonas allomyrinae]QAY62778.1 hypothetical protein ET495_05350 [Xylanimonas allomyrinae]
MELADDVGRGAWLAGRAGGWGRVGGVAGTGFEAYARLLHPVDAWRDDPVLLTAWGTPVVAEEARWPWAEVAARREKVMHPLVQWRRLTDDETALDLPGGWHVEQSREGWFAPDLLAALTVHLGAATTTPEGLTAGVWNGFGKLTGSSFVFVFADGTDPQEAERTRAELAAQRERSVSPAVRAACTRGPFLHWPGRDFLLLDTSLDELSDPGWVHRAGLGWDADTKGVMPQLLWPADHAWVVASEIDWDSTIVAGPRTLIDAVLGDPLFEAYGVSEDADLTWDGDTVNPRIP